MASAEEDLQQLRKRRSSIDIPPDLRLLLAGFRGRAQFALTNAILQIDVFDGAAVSARQTAKHCGEVRGQRVTLVNLPNLSESTMTPLKNNLQTSLCFSSPGPHAVLFVLDVNDIPPDGINILKPITEHFGGNIIAHTMVVLYYEGAQSPALESSVIQNRHFKELMEHCGQRYHIFSRDSADDSACRELLRKVNTASSDHGHYSSQYTRMVEKRIQQEEHFIRKRRAKEIRNTLKQLEGCYSGEDHKRRVEEYEEAMRVQIRERAEAVVGRLGCAVKLVDCAAAVAKGAAVGALCGAAVGLNTVALGAAVGAAVGVLVGGAVGAAWNYMSC
uniref:AIG1-type G domain-containing protein n=1 Tax=Denticeps clupeoides TaxID=299321 RepID=A0AAY4BPM4_9TELE